MATKRTPGSRPGLIRCENCGEEYSSSYRRCPFCDEYEDYEDYGSSSARSDSTSARGGGKRLAPSNRRGGGYTRISPVKIISFVISLAIILAAVWIVAAKVVPLIQRGNVTTPDSQTGQNLDADTTPPGTSDDAGTDVSSQPAVSPDTPPSPGVSPSPDVSTENGGATGLSLNKTEFAFSDRYPDPVTLQVTFTPSGSVGTITWSSSDSDIVSVDANGKVSPGAKRGTATITATLPNGAAQTCKVYNQITSAAASSNSSTGTSSESSSGAYTVNNPDFTFYRAGETFTLQVTGYSGGVTWSSSDTSVATVSSDGTVTAVGTGKDSCTVTGTLDDGSTVKAIVRINIS